MACVVSHRTVERLTDWLSQGIGLSGDLATIVAGLSHSLRHLDLSGNALTGNLNDRWQNFIHLEVVNLAQNQLSGGLR